MIGNQESAQMAYAELLLEIANGNHFKGKYSNFSAVEINNTAEEEEEMVNSGEGKTIALSSIELILDINNCVSWLYPQGFDLFNMHRTCILAATNNQVKDWNTIIRKLNRI